MIEPNEARVMLFFGVYRGTLNQNGFWWVNPFYIKKKITYRARNLDVEPIKVNDKAGNPVMIGLVLVWKVKDTYKAMFEIDSQETAGTKTIQTKQGAVTVQQRETLATRMAAYQELRRHTKRCALRNLAGEYAYDNNETSDEITLRSGGEEINSRLEVELNNRLAIRRHRGGRGPDQLSGLCPGDRSGHVAAANKLPQSSLHAKRLLKERSRWFGWPLTNWRTKRSSIWTKIKRRLW